MSDLSKRRRDENSEVTNKFGVVITNDVVTVSAALLDRMLDEARRQVRRPRVDPRAPMFPTEEFMF